MRQLNLHTSLALFCLLVCPVPTLDAADWPEFRGPTRDGVAGVQELPSEWSSTSNIRWRTELPGEGWSSPINVGGRIYVTAAIPAMNNGESDGYDLGVIVLDCRSGEILREIKLFHESQAAPKIHQKNSHASPTPLFDGSNIFVHFGHQGTACITTAGEVVWKNDSMAYAPVHGNGGSPIVVGELLIFTRDGADVSEVFALNKSSGSVVWKTERDVEVNRKFSFCTPYLLRQAEREQLIVPGSNVVQSLDPQTGREYWRVNYEGYSVIPRPIFEAGLVFVCTGYDRPSLLAIDPNGSGDVTSTHVVWQANSNIPKTPSLVGSAGRVAMVSDNGIASCYDASDGKELWRTRIGGDFSASPILCEQSLYLISEQGVCTVLDIAGQEPQTVAVNELGERCLASPAVVDADLLIRSAKAIYRISQHVDAQ